MVQPEELATTGAVPVFWPYLLRYSTKSRAVCWAGFVSSGATTLAQESKTVAMVGGLNIGLLVGVVLVTKLAFHGAALINAIGFLCVGLNIVMYASPLAAMRTVIRTNSVEFMPYYLSLFIFINGGIWALYAFLDRDWFLGVPNGLGFIFGAAQLILYAIYSRTSAKVDARPSSSSSSSCMDDGDCAQSEPLIIAPSPQDSFPAPIIVPYV
ncbi:unnamed protein product [Cuscuta campestris]|uniref:Bidirectional sugar transporter SWEET n=1 Tax=Cuscuta campestris TaxID=132261 RepID=A0A484M988_9ASTE|nr:unnamed protein product [Cuscuta campestris]